MNARVYQINANRDFLGCAYKQLDYHKSATGSDAIAASIYDLVYEGFIDDDDFEVGHYTFDRVGAYNERYMYLSDVIEILESKSMEPGFYYVNGDSYVKVAFDAAKAHRKESIRVLYVPPGELAQIVDIDATCASFEDLVGGLVGHREFHDDHTRIVCNAYAHDMKMTTNRMIYESPRNVDIIRGPFFICRSGVSSYESLTEEQQKLFLKQFQYPQRFLRAGDTIVARTYNPKTKSKVNER